MEKIFYLAYIFNAVRIIGIFMFAFGILGSVVFGISRYTDCEGKDDPDYPSMTNGLHLFIALLVVGTIITIFVPDKKTYLFMKGGQYVDTFVEDNPDVKELPSNTISLINEYIKAETESVKSKKSDKD